MLFIRIRFPHQNKPNRKNLKVKVIFVSFFAANILPKCAILGHKYCCQCTNIIYGARKGVLGTKIKILSEVAICLVYADIRYYLDMRIGFC